MITWKATILSNRNGASWCFSKSKLQRLEVRLLTEAMSRTYLAPPHEPQGYPMVNAKLHMRLAALSSAS